MIPALMMVSLMAIPGVVADDTYNHKVNWSGPAVGEVFLYVDGETVPLFVTAADIVYDYQHTKVCGATDAESGAIQATGGVTGAQAENGDRPLPGPWTIDGLTILGVAGGAWPRSGSDGSVINERFSFNVQGPVTVSAAVGLVRDYVTGEGLPTYVETLIQKIQQASLLEVGFNGGGTAVGYWTFVQDQC